ncbi:MAG: response regulator transcription factor [Planctomycetota bacterium]
MEHVLLVEDEAAIADTLADFLTERGMLVRRAVSVTEATAALRVATFSIVLLDLGLPDGDGLDVLKALRRGGTATPVIALTARGTEAQRVRGLKLGADDYVVKPFSAHELLARIEAVLRRAGRPAVQITLGDAAVDLDGHAVTRDGRAESLLPKEAELLAFLLRHRGRTCDREELLREVWGFDRAPTTRTVDTHVFNLRRKIEANPDQPRFLLTVRGVGYRLSD